jgi:hypothetical protein
MIFCIRRLPGLDPAEFSRYWRYEHAALFADYAETLRVKRYTQSHRTPEGLNDALRAHRTAPHRTAMTESPRCGSTASTI